MRAKIILFMILIVLFTIIISQNSGSINIQILFWSFEASRIVVIALTGFIGIILGFILASIYSSAGKKEIKEETKPQQEKKSEPEQEKKSLNNQ